jgi:hypothetical protein
MESENANGRLFDMPSGAKLYVSIAAYDDVMDLHDALATELRGKGLGSLDVAAVWKTVQAAKASKERPEDESDGAAEAAGLNVLADKVLAVGASKEFKAAVFKCAEKAVYRPDGELASSIPFRVGQLGYGVFDNPKCRDQAREDFYAIIQAIVEENLRPFGKALFSMFTAHVARSAAFQKSPSGQDSAKATS